MKYKNKERKIKLKQWIMNQWSKGEIKEYFYTSKEDKNMMGKMF
jgi:hypothetical protein